jgi:hypothetical protein
VLRCSRMILACWLDTTNGFYAVCLATYDYYHWSLVMGRSYIIYLSVTSRRLGSLIALHCSSEVPATHGCEWNACVLLNSEVACAAVGWERTLLVGCENMHSSSRRGHL